jgi:osmotically-inducible protein OsmY
MHKEAHFMVSLGCRKALPLIAALVVALCGCAGSSSQESTGESVADSAISGKVKAALAADPHVRAPELINVQTLRGVVHLTGTADSRLEKDQAVAIAREVDGVRGVKDDIIVRVSRRPLRD